MKVRIVEDWNSVEDPGLVKAIRECLGVHSLGLNFPYRYNMKKNPRGVVSFRCRRL